jgi:hypothetical protein
MPIPVKPCEGFFSEETNRLLVANVGRAQWQLHPCERCGQQVGARLDKGRWVPEAHWPSVRRWPSPRSATKVPAAKNEDPAPEAKREDQDSQ